LVCCWAVLELGISGTSVGKLLSLGQPAVSRAVVRGEKLAQDMKLSLSNKEMHLFMTPNSIITLTECDQGIVKMLNQ
jgi:hypothetical protein